MSSGINRVTGNNATDTTHATYQRRPQLQGSGPWATLDAPFWVPSSLTGGLEHKSFLFGASPETGYLRYRGNASGGSQAYQLFKMLPILTSSGVGGALKLLHDTNSSSDGNRDSDKCSPQPAVTQNVSEDLPLFFSSSCQFGGQEVAVAFERQEVRRTSNLQLCEASATPSFSMDLSSEGSVSSDNVGGCGDSSPDRDSKAAMEVEGLKAEIVKLQKKLERKIQRDDFFNKRVLQMERYSREETTALLKAICWKGQLHMEYDDLPIRQILVRMGSMLYWDGDFRGEGSLLDKFRENLTGKRDRDCVSIKWRWNRIIKTLAKKPNHFFQKQTHAHQIDDDDKLFLIKLAKVSCVLKGIDPSKKRLSASTVPLSQPTSPSSSSGSPFQNDHGFPNRWRDMPVLTASQFSK